MIKQILPLIITVFFVGCSNVKALDVEQIIANKKHALRKLESIRMTAKENDGSSIKDIKAEVDYKKRAFFVVKKMNSTILEETYFKDEILYRYSRQGEEGQWVKFTDSMTPVIELTLNSEVRLALMPDDFKNTGFKAELLGEENISGEPCYMVGIEMVDPLKAKEFFKKALSEVSFSREYPNIEFFKEYLINSLVNINNRVEWISKKTFLPIKDRVSSYRPTSETAKSVISYDYSYYDFNKPVTVVIPKEAQDAEECSGQCGQCPKNTQDTKGTSEKCGQCQQEPVE